MLSVGPLEGGAWGSKVRFVLEQRVPLTESLTVEFKEVGSSVLQAVAKIVDAYVVAFLNSSGGSIYWGISDDRIVKGARLSAKGKDELLRLIGDKISAIAPAVGAEVVEAPFHTVVDAADRLVEDNYVIEVRVTLPKSKHPLYATGSGEVHRRTLAGTRRLTGAELILALMQSAAKSKFGRVIDSQHLARFPSVHRRASVVEPMLRGRRILWVDDDPPSTLYERMALSEIGVQIDQATSTEEALVVARTVRPSVVISDMKRYGNHRAGLEMLTALRRNGFDGPVIYYIGAVDEAKGTPPGSFGITNMPEDLLHVVFDALERLA